MRKKQNSVHFTECKNIEFSTYSCDVMCLTFNIQKFIKHWHRRKLTILSIAFNFSFQKTQSILISHWHDSVPYQDVFCYRLNVTGMIQCRTRTYFATVWTSLAWVSGVPGRILVSFERHWHDSVAYQDVFCYRLITGMTQCRTRTYFATVWTVWAPILSAQKKNLKSKLKHVNSLIIYLVSLVFS